MNPKVRPRTILLALFTVDFLAFTVYAAVTAGWSGIVDTLGTNIVAQQMVLDLLLALAVATGFVFVDAKKNGMNPWVYVALVLSTGSGGLLAYLVMRDRRASVAARPQPPLLVNSAT